MGYQLPSEMPPKEAGVSGVALLALVEPPRGAAGQRVPQAVGEGVVVAAEVVVEAAA